MVVEDNDPLRLATVNVLRQAGFDVVGVSSAEDVDDEHKARLYDGYVIDLNLPGEDGLSLALRLRGAYPGANIIMTTARTHLNDRVKGYESGADIYMAKPVDPVELVAVLRRLTARSNLAHNAALGLRIIPQRHLLTGPTGQAVLSASEVRVLTALAQAKDNTLERWQLMVHLSPDNSQISDDSLQVRLSQLRKKMAQCCAEGLCIKALRGRGYKLCVPLVIE
jgi:DNA-binding response OmpR family regulator